MIPPPPTLQILYHFLQNHDPSITAPGQQPEFLTAVSILGMEMIREDDHNVEIPITELLKIGLEAFDEGRITEAQIDQERAEIRDICEAVKQHGDEQGWGWKPECN